MLLVNADNVNTLDGSLHTTKKNAEALVVVSKEIGLEMNADKTRYMVKSRDQNAGRSRNAKTDNSSFERVEVQIFGNNLNRSKFYSGKN